MKIVINNIQFPFDKGCKLLKLQHSKCPYPQLEDFWDDIIPYTFKDIAQFENLEERRVGILCLGLDRLVSEVNAKLEATETIAKKSTWINSKGELENVEFDDTYELWRVSAEDLNPKNVPSWRRGNDVFYLQFKDTSTDRRYLLWVDTQSVYRTNHGDNWVQNPPVTPLECVAWTLMVNVPKGNIEKILRQGDCIMVKVIDTTIPLLDTPRHLTLGEYKTLLVAES